MIYSGSAQYAIRAIVRIAEGPTPGAPVSAAGLAAADGIPPFYLAKVLQDLSRAGLLGSARGRGGGFFLSKSPAEITVFEVVSVVQDLRPLETDCVLGIGPCGDDVACPAHESWKHCRDDVLRMMHRMTVADLVDRFRANRPAN